MGVLCVCLWGVSPWITCNRHVKQSIWASRKGDCRTEQRRSGTRRHGLSCCEVVVVKSHLRNQKRKAPSGAFRFCFWMRFCATRSMGYETEGRITRRGEQPPAAGGGCRVDVRVEAVEIFVSNCERKKSRAPQQGVWFKRCPPSRLAVLRSCGYQVPPPQPKDTRLNLSGSSGFSFISSPFLPLVISESSFFLRCFVSLLFVL